MNTFSVLMNSPPKIIKVMKKKNFVFLLLLVMTIFVHAQTVYFPYENLTGSYFNVNDSINFEESYSQLQFDADSLWQIGSPDKILFNQAWSPPNVIITDTVGAYPDSVNTWFYLKYYPWYEMNLFVSFNQRVDVGEGDSCIVEFSVNSTDWMSFQELNSMFSMFGWPHLGTYAITDLATENTVIADSLTNPVFSDTTTVWEQHSFWFLYNLAVKDTQYFFTDSLYVRFRFVSDENFASQEGWMIDNFYIGDWNISTPVEEFYSKTEIVLMPNPCDGNVELDCANCVYPIHVQCFDLLGKLMYEKKLFDRKLDVTHLPNGQYILHFIDASSQYNISKLLIQK